MEALKIKHIARSIRNTRSSRSKKVYRKKITGGCFGWKFTSAAYLQEILSYISGEVVLEYFKRDTIMFRMHYTPVILSPGNYEVYGWRWMGDNKISSGKYKILIDSIQLVSPIKIYFIIKMSEEVKSSGVLTGFKVQRKIITQDAAYIQPSRATPNWLQYFYFSFKNKILPGRISWYSSSLRLGDEISPGEKERKIYLS